jgi:GNAT superfamily N-acetyltransferase
VIDPSNILTAIRRSDRALVEQIAQWESLDFGVAYTSTGFATLPEANQLRDVWLADVDGPTAFTRAEAYYAQRGLTCQAWTAASSQPPEPVDALLISKGWRRVDRLAMALVHWNAPMEHGRPRHGEVSTRLWNAPQVPSVPSIRILPARAMRKAYRATFGDDEPLSTICAEAGLERLNDANLDTFVATLDGQPAGRISYLSVGDAARLTDLHVLPTMRRRHVGLHLVAHALQLARRLSPKALVATVGLGNSPGKAILERCGFEGHANLTTYFRS